MKMPWHGKAGLAKATAVLATLLLVSTGLCGTNYLAVFAFRSLPNQSGLATLLILTGTAELIGIVIGILGLFIVAAIVIVKALRKVVAARSNGGNSQP
jgi:hypothetical protein